MNQAENSDLGEDFRLDEELILSGRAGQQFLECLTVGDADSLADDSHQLMRLFTQQMFISGNSSKALQFWIAESFYKFLEGEAKSLDAAFNLRRRGRPLKMTPKAKRIIVNAYAKSLRDSAISGVAGREAEIRAEHAAFFALKGRTVEQATCVGGEGALADSLDRIRSVVNDFFRKK